MTTEFVMVPVPHQRVQEVFRLLGSDPIEATSEIARPADDDATQSWSESEIARAYRESPERMKRFLDYLAGRSGRPATRGDTAKAVGYTHAQQRGMLGAFGHRVKGRYGKSKWFFDYSWNDEQRASVYSMEPEASKVILALQS